MKGKRVKLSQLHEGDVFHFVGRRVRCIVTDRIPSDRCTGGTHFVSDTGGSNEMFWDYNNPDVIYLGKGKLTIMLDGENTR